MSRSIFALLLPAVVALSACDPDDPCSVASTVEPTFELGVGESDFTRLNDGDVLHETWGMQGGSHIWIAYRTEGVVTGQAGAFKAYEPGPQVMFTLTSVDGVQVGDGNWSRPMEGDETGAVAAGAQLYVWVPEDPAPDLSELTLTATLTDRCGAELSDSVMVTVDGWQ